MSFDAPHNAFLVIRTVFFALLTYAHILILVFASWNITAAKSFGMSAPGASVFLLMTSVFVFMLVPTAYLAELICPKAAHVKVECAWTVLMSVFQLAASVAVTVSGPPTYCQTQSPWSMCASSFLLVHVTWLATFIILFYCLTLSVAASAHGLYFPGIWTTPVPLVPWFRSEIDIEKATATAVDDLPLPALKHMKSCSSSWSDASCVVSKYIAERWDKLSPAERQSVLSSPILITKGRPSVEVRARQQSVRHDVGQPVAKPLSKRKERPAGLVPPPRILPRQNVSSWDSRFVEHLNMTRASSYATLTPRTPTVFPPTAGNPDLPVQRPRLTEWVRADATRGALAREESP